MSAQLIESSPVEPLVVGVHLYPGDTWFREVHVRSVTTQAPVDLSGWVFEARLGEHVGVVDASRAAEGRLAVTFSPEQTADAVWGDVLTVSGTLAGGRRTFLHGAVGAVVGSSIPVGSAQKTRVVSSDVDISVYAAPRGDKGQDGSAVSVALVQRAESAEGRAVSAADAAEGYASSARTDASLATAAAAAADGFVDETAANARVSLEATAGIVAARDAAAASATKANTDADRAGTSAFNSAGSAAAAQSSEDDARGFRDGAKTHRDAAEGFKTAAETAKTGAEAARDLALAGQFAGTQLIVNADLNTLTTPGVYRVPNTAQNAPTAAFIGVVLVFARDSGRIVQVAYRQNGDSLAPVSWARASYGAAGTPSWSAWRTSSSQRINNPAGQPGIELNLWDDQNNRDQPVLITGVDLGTTDLNAVTLPGVYRNANSANATLARNYPAESGAFVVEVFASGVAIEQRAHIAGGAPPSGDQAFYVRRYNGSMWTPWRTFLSSEWDYTAGRVKYDWDIANQRKQLTYGDTGWRDITNLLMNGATAQVALIRRVGSYVSFRAVALQLPLTSPQDPIYAPPAGFVSEEVFGVFRERINTGNGFGFQMANNVRLWGNLGTAANNTTHRFDGSLHGMTGQAWPSTLPGTAYGAIPNN